MEEIDIEKLVRDREAFDAFVYTPFDEAMWELANRECDANLKKRMQTLIPDGVPDVLVGRQVAVMSRQIATPNYETIKFLDILKANNYLQPMFWEYYDDKFTSNNEYKHSLGKMIFYGGQGKNGGPKMDRHTVIDFNGANGKKISQISTLWGENFVDFHHNLLSKIYPNTAKLFDGSSWFQGFGGNAANYYESFLRLFVQNGILFENFMLDGEEHEFTKTIFLPAFIKVFKDTGYKPLIVAIFPTKTENDPMWIHYPIKAGDRVKKSLLRI